MRSMTRATLCHHKSMHTLRRLYDRLARGYWHAHVRANWWHTLLAISWMITIRAFALIGFAYMVTVLACGLRVFFPITMPH